MLWWSTDALLAHAMADGQRSVLQREGAVTQQLTQYPSTSLPHGSPAQQPKPERAEASEAIDSIDHEELQEAPPTLTGITVLLVDDDPDIRALMRTFLEHIGFRVLTSGDADRAAQIFLGAQHVDLLIVDQNMPGRSGMDLAVQLKVVDPELPVLMISGAMETASSNLFRQPGWTFLPKPFSLPALLDTVHRILETAGSAAEPGRPGMQGRAASA
jgi:two-component system, chemotaxis family, chemotaxis protein CheY